MINIKFISFLFVFSLFSLSLMGQKTCKVLLKNIKGSYEGECERGYASGEGVAIGTDTYRGKFKKGYPQGKGNYLYADDSFYTGEWKKGLRHGEGSYTFKVEGRDSTLAGKWKKDEYLGPIKKAAYLVEIARGVTRYTFRRIGDGDRVMIKTRLNGMVNSELQDLRLMANQGTQLYSHDVIGYENIDEFPFTCKINYVTYNQLRTSQNDVLFTFTINEPGEWEITINN